MPEKDSWAKQHQFCTKCGNFDKPHRALGLCITCYARKVYHEKPQLREQIKSANKTWRDKNKDRVDELQRKAAKRYYYRNREEILRKQKESREKPIDLGGYP